MDALGDKNAPMVGIEHRATVEARLRQLEGKTGKALSGSAKGKGKDLKYDGPAKGAGGSYAGHFTPPHSTLRSPPGLVDYCAVLAVERMPNALRSRSHGRASIVGSGGSNQPLRDPMGGHLD